MMGAGLAKKAGATTIGAGSLITLVLTLHSGVSARLDAQEKSINSVRLEVAPVNSRLDSLNKNVENNQLMLREIYMYMLKKKPTLKEE